ncbi:cytochrome c [Geobacter pelophilus]|uniref:Cytochrome c n=1 Tax=Geoanaerobacter pelophilus TaxID=60036 RepID=A0AAW4L331_9BACT|nr:cytochrome c [Geoanaerobacter pelophilus]MBT0663040.1 cytochrome c [Geoanaerobacter pelophilus]
MKRTIVITVSCLALGLLSVAGSALAHGTEKHDKGKLADVQMKKLHTMMPLFSLVSAELEKAIEKRDSAAVELEAGKMLRAIPELKKSKPHKNVNQQKKFVELAESLELALTSTNVMAEKGDFAGARKAFKKVEETCAACHAKFRD